MPVIAYAVNLIFDFYVAVVFVTVIMSWLIGFNVINRHNKLVDVIWRTCTGLTEPVLAPIRRMLPNIGGVDISPVVLLIGLSVLRFALNLYVFGPLTAGGVVR